MEHYLDYKIPPKYKTYKDRAKQNFPDEGMITEQKFNELSKQPCYYCGTKGPNGIDRIENDVGYADSNCVPCCKHCNYVKGNLSRKNFDIWRKRFVIFQSKNER